MKIYIRKFKTLIEIMFYYISSLGGSKNCSYYSAKETVELAIKKKKSIIRLGDGEFNVIAGKGVSYQQKNEKLREDICSLIEEYINSEDSKFILCMPGEFLYPNGIKLKYKQVVSWAFSRYYFKKNYDTSVIYGDAFLFAKGNEQIYSLLWRGNHVKHIVFAHNNKSYGEKFKKVYKKNTTFIQVPSRDAYDAIDDIEMRIVDSVTAPKDSLILLSIGPCAKVLVKRLADRGYWAIDTGHCWDEPLHLRK